MIEKRFWYRVNKDDFNIEFEIIDADRDEYFPIINSETLVQNLVKCLNELNDENTQLKAFLEALKEELSLADRDNTQLEKENKELKDLINEIIRIAEKDGVIGKRQLQEVKKELSE